MLSDDLISNHFNSKAKNYQTFWEKWPFSVVRNSELNAVFKLLGNVHNKEVLELGCGSGYYTRKLLEKNISSITAVDFSEEMLSNLPKGPINPIHADASSIDLKKQFQIILSAGMLEFVDNPEQVLINIAKHADKDATIVLLLPRNNFFGKLYKFYHKKNNNIVINLFNETKITKLLYKANLNIDSIVKCGAFSFALRLRKLVLT